MDDQSSIYATLKVDTANVESVLQHLAGTDLVARGAVVVISVEAIQRLAPERWPRKRDGVWTYVERKLNEHLSYHDISQRVSETDFLVAMTAEEGAAAQAIAMKVLEEVLTYFLGAAQKTDIKIRSVTNITEGGLECTDLDPAGIRAEATPKPPAAIRREIDPDEERRRNPVSFIIASGETLRIDFHIETVISLRHQVAAALRVRPQVRSATTGRLIPAPGLKKLSDDDVAAIDRATFDYGALFLSDPTISRRALMLPASFRSMSTRKGRASLGTVRGATLEQIRCGVVIELTDVDRGTPAGRLSEVAGLVGSLARAVMVRVPASRNALAAVKGARMPGLTVDLSELDLPDEQLAAALRAMALQMRGAAPSLMALGLRADHHRDLAWEAGFTHAGVTYGQPGQRAATKPPKVASPADEQPAERREDHRLGRPVDGMAAASLL